MLGAVLSRKFYWERCTKYADATHVKTFYFDEDGWETTTRWKPRARRSTLPDADWKLAENRGSIDAR